MSLEEKDFIMRQTKQLAEGLGKFLGKESVDEILKQDEKQADNNDKNKTNKQSVKKGFNFERGDFHESND